jgi:hypothetical protein
MANYNAAVNAQQDAVRAVEAEKNEVLLERQKLNLESKKLMKL